MRVPVRTALNEPDSTNCCFLMLARTPVSYVESGQPQVCPVGSSSTRGLRESRPSSCLFFWNLQREVHLSSDFFVDPIRRDRCPFAAADLHASAWLTLQAHRGLTHNTLDAYSRALERLQADGAGLSNATMQQLLTVVRLFHAI